ncbi:Protein of unknown function (DUF3037) [Owenweeksia hongkongensis DSM 17368]|uniref:DUF3037 domain-containing protein n=1 Tax=Owenweeksia hongkongensis (strain DSM 17368 / CIP 108786 / JCM 12287 / NRRL B-23963 / UST20020801) TaxID=926562 RepID=G8QZQ0_OWEHD|nr:DUF3037 domain-containing protein [Owenweeksia hongkongensis]AEV31494.1 Protein of unknown function (DUF3037) [Owenweeksia hongkongensis DSM 17368]
MNKQFSYSILKYRHNHVVEESLNIGVLFFFADSPKVVFVAPPHIKRLSHAFPDAPIQSVNALLKSFNSQAQKLSEKAISYLNDYDSLISEWFLTPNGSSVYFDGFRQAPIWKNETETINYFTTKYLAGYGKSLTESKVTVHSESYILNKYKQLLADNSGGRQLNAFVKEEKIEVKNELISFTSDSYWQNGTQNLVKAVSFDLQSEDGIETKALALAKKLEVLSSVLQDNQQRVDLLLSKPSNRDLIGVYKSATSILQHTNAPHKLIEEKKLVQYTNKVLTDAIEI